MKINRILFWSISSISLITLFNSCCTDQYCSGIDDLYSISFYNFDPLDLDTILVIRYEKESNFQNYLDTVSVYSDFSSGGHDPFSVYLNENLSVYYDYEVCLISTDQIFTLTDFEVKEKKCNTGLFCTDYYDALVSYKVNGQKVNEYLLIIDNNM